MIPIRRGRSFNIRPTRLSPVVWWLNVLAVTFLLVFLSPLARAEAESSRLLRLGGSLFFPLILWTWTGGHPWRGIGLVAWACGITGLVALAARDFLVGLQPLLFLGLGWIAHRGMIRWNEGYRLSVLKEERLKENLNTQEQELFRLKASGEALRQRFQRYEELKGISNTFCSLLSLEELLAQIVRSTGKVVPAADRVLLYLVDPQSLALELKSVWRRFEEPPIKAKRGDPFDSWVMRQAQPLLVEDTRSDFRFSPQILEESGRALGSLLLVPLLNEIRLIGILRGESVQALRLGDQELRLTKIVGDLASLSLENTRLYHRMEGLAVTDDLTGLSVQRVLKERLKEETVRASEGRSPLCLLLIDIDRFKVYNDTFGHSAGDKLLKTLASLLSQMRKPGELVARYGGEEFVFLLPGTGRKEACARAEAIRSHVERVPIELRRALTKATVSIGISSFPEDGQEPESLLRKADERLYRAKASGRNRICL